MTLSQSGKDLFALSSYQYHLPQELIAQHPCSPRDHSRLMIIDRKTGRIEEIPFFELVHFLDKEDQLIFNDTKVMPAKLKGHRPGGGAAEFLLLKKIDDQYWEALAKPGKRLKPGMVIQLGEDFFCRIEATTESGNKILSFSSKDKSVEELLEIYGKLPLPLYIKEEQNSELEKQQYQTIYASQTGAVAAPTAGLHFSENMFSAFKEKGIEQHYLTLHVGILTFKPVKVDDIRQHAMHEEKIIVSNETALKLNLPLKTTSQGKKAKRICVGTTSCRAVESAADPSGFIHPGEDQSSIFIYPGYQFKYTTQLLTNFHLPGSTLLMLVSAFAGYELTMEAYAKAIEKKFRFYSYGDAMLII